MGESKYPGYVDHGSKEYEYDCGSPDFTGDKEKLSPYIREIQDQIVKEAFGDKEQGATQR
ncbi:MAG: hypothetical protein LBB72_01580 [Spirochaetaceae bacterium]|jgi:hypothetical protein|nr:hypothetical protein [Spirochaetaceae bacterium]